MYTGDFMTGRQLMHAVEREAACSSATASETPPDLRLRSQQSSCCQRASGVVQKEWPAPYHCWVPISVQGDDLSRLSDRRACDFLTFSSGCSGDLQYGQGPSCFDQMSIVTRANEHTATIVYYRSA